MVHPEAWCALPLGLARRCAKVRARPAGQAALAVRPAQGRGCCQPAAAGAGGWRMHTCHKRIATGHQTRDPCALLAGAGGTTGPGWALQGGGGDTSNGATTEPGPNQLTLMEISCVNTHTDTHAHTHHRFETHVAAASPVLQGIAAKCCHAAKQAAGTCPDASRPRAPKQSSCPAAAAKSAPGKHATL